MTAFFTLTPRRGLRVGEGAAAGAAGVRGRDGVGQQRRTVGPGDRENVAGRRGLDSPERRGTLRCHGGCGEDRPPFRGSSQWFFFITSEGLWQEWVTSAADGGCVLVR